MMRREWFDRDLRTASGKWIAYSELMSGGRPIDRGTIMNTARSIIAQKHDDRTKAREMTEALKPQVEMIYA